MEKLLILDTSAIMYRSHFAMEKLINKNGVSTGAIFGFVKQLQLALEKVNPDYVACAYDVKKTELNRKKIFSEYKQNRAPMPSELLYQVEIIKEIIQNFGISSFSKDGYEADDVIASLTNFGIKNNLEIHIYTGDKDIQQLVTKDNNVFIHILVKNEVISTYDGVKEKLKVYPNQIPDFFGLKGDSSDGIPGVLGVGDVSGSKLIEKYDNLENIYEHIDEIKGKMKENLINCKDLAFISRKLATVNRDIDFKISLNDLKMKEKNIENLKDIFLKFELHSFLNFLDKKTELKIHHKTCSFEELCKIIQKAKIASLYFDDNFISCCIDEIVYICDNVSEDTLFSVNIKLSDLNTNALLIVYDAKKYMHEGITFNNFFDILIASYVINTQEKFEIENILGKYSNIEIETLDKKRLKNISIEELKDRHIKICYSLLKIYPEMKQKLTSLDIKNTYEKIEKPLIPILYSMEKYGICIDKNELQKLYEKFNLIVKREENEIYKLAGHSDFNIESPIQLGNVLFNELQIPIIKKTKRGYSTDAEVLETLAHNGVNIASHLLNFRYYKKLLSTYIEPLPSYADKNSRIHSVFNGTGTVTGRLSSQNPNLQNIPARTNEGNMIRNCFVASENMKLVSFDYSQIELRVLAELSKDENLIHAYENDLDLHAETAKKLFPNTQITSEKRNIGKVVNFSVLYGKTPFGLSKELKISLKDAKQYIDTYFNTYKGVTNFIDKIIEDCKTNLYVETLFGTRRYIPEINSKNVKIFEEAKRKAINTVVQGTAANIIKLVMIKLFEKGYKMLIQVHDELIFELPSSKADKLSQEIKEIMENTIKFNNVTLKTNYKIADKWGALK